MQHSMTAPRTVWLALTNGCNNQCAWCYEQSNQYRNSQYKIKDFMPLGGVISLLSTLAKAGTRRCILIGGEPTLYADLRAIIYHINEVGLNCVLVTNGRRASDYSCAQQLFDYGLKEVTVSFHGWSEDSFKRGGNSGEAFHQSIKGYANLKKAGIKTGITIVLGQHTFGCVTEIVEFLNNQGIHQIG